MGLAAQLLLSVLGIAALSGLAWALGFRAAPRLSEPEAQREAEAALPGFRAADAAIAEGARAGLVRGADGSLAVVLPRGADWVVRRLPPGSVDAESAGMVQLMLNEPGLRQLRLAFPALPDWLRRP